METIVVVPMIVVQMWNVHRNRSIKKLKNKNKIKKYQNSQSEFYIVRFTNLIRDEIFCNRSVLKKAEAIGT